MKNTIKTKDMTLIALFTALIIICSWITIPTAIPFTLQIFAIFTTLGILGGKRGTISILIYLLLGCIGLPVFSGMRSGFGTLFGVTGGYLLGFTLSALLYWAIMHIKENSLPLMITAMLLGLIVCYLFGTAWFMILYTKNTDAITLLAVLQMCVFPFIVPDLIKIALSIVLVKTLRRRIPS